MKRLLGKLTWNAKNTPGNLRTTKITETRGVRSGIWSRKRFAKSMGAYCSMKLKRHEKLAKSTSSDQRPLRVTILS